MVLVFVNNSPPPWSGDLEGKSFFALEEGAKAAVVRGGNGGILLLTHDKPLKNSGGTLMEVDESGNEYPVKTQVVGEEVKFVRV